MCLCSPAADINLGLIRYVLHQENVQETMDNFKFLVKDSKPNVVSDNVFHIQWSLISFEHKRFVSRYRNFGLPNWLQSFPANVSLPVAATT